MKKILYSILALTFVLPVMASAATFSFSPSTGSFASGETFSVVVYVNPDAGEEITTAKLSAVFSTSELEVVSFTQADGWIPLMVPGSDLLDNADGKLIKTGGFPARATESKSFGTLILKAKSDGTATVSVASDSMLLDSENINKYASSVGASFAIITPAPIIQKTTTESVVNDVPDVFVKTPIAPSIEDTAPASDEDDVDVINTPTSQNQVATAVEAGTKTTWYYVLAVLVLLLGIGVFAWRKRGKGNFQQ